MHVKTGLYAGEILNGAQGLGDIIADLTQLTGLDQLAKSYEEVTGQSCGCKQRQRKLNLLFPTVKNA